MRKARAAMRAGSYGVVGGVVWGRPLGDVGLCDGLGVGRAGGDEQLSGVVVVLIAGTFGYRWDHSVRRSTRWRRPAAIGRLM